MTLPGIIITTIIVAGLIMALAGRMRWNMVARDMGISAMIVGGFWAIILLLVGSL